jgi:hypothetical protein
VLEEHVRERIGTGFEANAKEQIGVMLPHFLVHEGPPNRFGRLRAEQTHYISRQVLT